MTTTDFDVLDARIRGFLDARAHDLEGMRDEEALVRSLEARLERGHAHRPRAGRPLLVLVAAGLLVVLLIASGLLGGSPVKDPRPESEVFRSESSLGTFEWVAATAPVRIWHEHEVDGHIVGRDEEGGWWRLDDEWAWQPTTPPGPGWVDYSTVGDETWAVVGSDGYAYNPGPLGHRQVIAYDWYEGHTAPVVLRHAADQWVEVPLPALEPPTADGLETFGPLLHPVASASASSWILPVEHFLEVPWDRIYGIEREGTEAATIADTDGDTVSSLVHAMWDEKGQRLELHERWPDVFARLAVYLVEGDPPTVEFRDTESGELVHSVEATVPGWSPADLLHAVRDWGGLDLAFVVGHDGQASTKRPPWPMSEEWSGDLAVSDGWYYTTSYALGQDYLADALHLWRSRDGLMWESVALPADFPHPLHWASLAAGPAGLALWVNHEPAETLWLSRDGTEWRRADLDDMPVSIVTGTDFGWFGDAGTVSADGEAWERIGLPPLPEDPPLGYLHGYLFRGPAEVEGRFVTWFGRLVD